MYRCSFVVAALSAGGVVAQPVDVFTLDFEGLADVEMVQDFYNGGTSQLGNTGTNFGVSFTGNALSIIDSDLGGSGNFANEPSESTVLFYQAGGSTVMNVAAGFDTAFSFFYSTNSFAQTGSNAFVTVYDGVNGTGNVLGSIVLEDNVDGTQDMGDPTGVFDTWTAIGVNFAGVARSVDFGGSANQVAFDDVTFGRIIPAPGAASLAALAGLAASRRRRS